MAFRVGTPHTRGAGYFVNNQNSANRQEADIQSCAHCQKVLFLKAWQADGGWCKHEMKPLCAPCADRALKFGCEPFLKSLEQHMTAQMRELIFSKLAGTEASDRIIQT